MIKARWNKQGGQLCLCPPLPAQPVPTSMPNSQLGCNTPGAPCGGCSCGHLRWEQGEGLAGQSEPLLGKGPAKKQVMQL